MVHQHNIPPNKKTFAALLNSYAVAGEIGMCRKILFVEMKKFEGCIPNIFCWNILLQACVHKKDCSTAVQIFNSIKTKSNNRVRPDVFSLNAVLDCFGKTGNNSEDAGNWLRRYLVLKHLTNQIKPDVVCFNTTISAFCNNNNSISSSAFDSKANFFAAFRWLLRIARFDLAPDIASFSPVILKAVKIDESLEICQRLLHKMLRKTPKTTPTVVEFSIVIHALCKKNEPFLVNYWLAQMKDANVEPDTVILQSVLSVFRTNTHRNMPTDMNQDMLTNYFSTKSTNITTTIDPDSEQNPKSNSSLNFTRSRGDKIKKRTVEEFNTFIAGHLHKKDTHAAHVEYEKNVNYERFAGFEHISQSVAGLSQSWILQRVACLVGVNEKRKFETDHGDLEYSSRNSVRHKR